MNYGGSYRTTTQYAPPKVNARPKVKLRVSYNLQNSDQVQHRRHCFGINSLAINEDEGHLYSAGRDSTVRCWDINKVCLFSYTRIIFNSLLFIYVILRIKQFTHAQYTTHIILFQSRIISFINGLHI